MKWKISSRYLLVISFFLSLALSPNAQSIPCEFRLELFDTGGDGWNGANLVVTVNGEASSYTLNNIDDDGTFATFPLVVSTGDTVSIRFLPGSANGEIIYGFFGPSGDLIGADGPFPLTGLLLEGTVICPACPPPPPAGIVIENVAAAEADISFRLSDPDGQYLIEYDTSGFTPGEGNLLINSSGEATLSGLAEKTMYDFYLTALCANGDTSDVLGPFTFETLWSIDVGVSNVVTPITGCALEAGEIVTVVLENFGNNPQSLIPFNFSVNNQAANVGMPQDGLYTGVLGRDSTDAFPFDARWDFSTPGEYIVSAWTELEDDQDLSNDTTAVTIVNIPFVMEYPYFQNFEEWAGGWTVGEESQNASWEFGEPTGNAINTAFSGNNAWVTNLSGSYLNNESSFLLSPCLDFSSFEEDPIISFFLNFISENCCDRAWLESSTDGGMTWMKVGTFGEGVNWYNDETNDAWAGDGNFEGWAYASNTLSGTAGLDDVRLRFVLSSDQGIANEGVGLDDIFIGTPLENDLVMVNAVNAGAECGSASDSISIVIGNYGQTTQNGFQISYQVNGGETITEEITGISLEPGGQLSYTFQTSFNSAPIGAYEIRAWTDADNEILRQNDTTVLSFINALALPFAENFENRNTLGAWSIDDDAALTSGHNNVSNVLSDNLWSRDQELMAITPQIGPIVAGDSLSFEYRIVDFSAPHPPQELADGDSLFIDVSTDCGETFTNIYQITAANHDTTTEMTQIRLSLEDFVGFAVKIRFFGQRRNAGDYYLDIDNVNVFQCSDLQLAAEVTNASDSNSENGSVRVIPREGLAPFSYNWSTGSITNTATQLAPGEYSVTVTDRLGCSSSIQARVDIGVATEEPEWLKALTLAPNPTNGNIYLQIPAIGSQDLQIDLLDMAGHILKRTQRLQFEAGTMEMNLSDYPDGLYFVRIIGGKHLKTLKVIKQ